MHPMITGLFLISLFNTSLFANEYEEAIREMNCKPVTQFDLRIQQLNLILNDDIKGLKSKEIYSFKNETKLNDVTYFNEILDSASLDVNYAYCQKDASNPAIISYEVSLSSNFLQLGIKARIKKIKLIHEKILDLTKSIIHPSFDRSNLKLVIKVEKTEDKRLTHNEILDLVGIAPFLESNESFDCQIPLDSYIYKLKMYKKIKKEEILIIWENGIPYYQDAFFDEPPNKSEYKVIDLTRRDWD